MIIKQKSRDNFLKQIVFLLVCFIAGIGLIGCEFDSTEPKGTCATPTFTIADGTYYEEQVVHIICLTQDAEVRFTLDGSTPTKNSTLYILPLNLSTSAYIKAKAFKKDYNSSQVSSAYYEIFLNKVMPPFSNPPAGEYELPQTVSLSCPTEGATIYYSFNYANLETNSHVYSEPLHITIPTVISVIAKKEGMTDSFVQCIAYNIHQPQVATPVMSYGSGTYMSPIYVRITCDLYNAAIYYTTDGTEPTTESTLYSNPILIDESLTLKAKAYKEYYTDSETAEATYTLPPTQFLMVYIPGGSYNMGSTLNSDEQPIHRVTLSPFYMSFYEVTVHDWSTIMITDKTKYAKNQNNPVTDISFYDILVFCNKKSISEGLTPVYTINNQTNPDLWGEIPNVSNSAWNSVSWDWNANGYRLPTEAEWEYAARGTTDTPNYTYAGSMDLFSTGWWANNSNGVVHYVGQKTPNYINLYDMSGNVWEWVWDIYGDAYYATSPLNNPIGPSAGTSRVIRGGGYNSAAIECRVAERKYLFPWLKSNAWGLRLARKDY